MLRCEVLFVSPAVYSCLALARVPLPGVGKGLPPFRPFFYVNVTDIHTLETELSYVACKYAVNIHYFFFKFWIMYMLTVVAVLLMSRYNRKDFRGEEAPLWCIRGQSDRADTQGELAATASAHRFWPREVQEIPGKEVWCPAVVIFARHNHSRQLV